MRCGRAIRRCWEATSRREQAGNGHAERCVEENQRDERMTSEKLKTKAFVYFFVAPAFLVLIGVVIYPFIFNIVISLSNMSLAHISGLAFRRFQTVCEVFTEESKPNFYDVFLKTIIWTVVNLIFPCRHRSLSGTPPEPKEIRGKRFFEPFWYFPGLFLSLL